MAKRTPMPERFWEKVAFDGEAACWLWTASTNHNGYGAFAIDSKVILRAHRLAYELLIGPIPEGLTLDHLCRVRSCVNPAHLEPVTRGENILRGESPSSRNARKTHCLRGHELAGENLYVDPSGYRACRTCSRARGRRRRAERRARRV